MNSNFNVNWFVDCYYLVIYLVRVLYKIIDESANWAQGCYTVQSVKHFIFGVLAAAAGYNTYCFPLVSRRCRGYIWPAGKQVRLNLLDHMKWRGSEGVGRRCKIPPPIHGSRKTARPPCPSRGASEALIGTSKLSISIVSCKPVRTSTED